MKFWVSNLVVVVVVVGVGSKPLIIVQAMLNC